MSNLTISQALNDIRFAKKALLEALRQHFPPGTPVVWERGGGKQTGIVVSTAMDRIKVKNDVTGKEYFIHAYCLTPEFGGGRKSI